MQWVNLAAILLGPILAVIITRIIDSRRDRYARRMHVFRELMRNRRNALSPDYVGALNLVEVEFYGEKDIEATWKALMIQLSTEAGEGEDKLKAWNEEIRARTTRLIHAMGKSLRFNMEQLDILAGGYAPRGWEDVEVEVRYFRRLMIETLRGDRRLPVSVGGNIDDDTQKEQAEMRRRLLAALSNDTGLKVNIHNE